MFNRKELKLKGKMDFLKNYWPMVGVAAFSALLSNDSLLNFEYSTYSNGISEATLTVFFVDIPIRLAYAIPAFLVVFAILSLITIFLTNVLRVGICRYYILNASEKPSFREVFFVLDRPNEVFWNVVKVEFLTSLSIFLWTLCFIIPGIIKIYEYYMVDYLLAENPMMSKDEAWATSKAMMEGNKMDTFILALSFFGWLLLSVFTANLLSVFFVSPYVSMTVTHLYLTLKNQYHHSSYQNDTFNYNEETEIMY